ncbi:MAG: patatin family protein [Solobacterium sp.]|jgi:predicted patatin/cPLA2 family phospholipase|nr:patatin family protein [Solobacterium sp.]
MTDKENMIPAGLAVEGGSFRGIFASGVLDAMMESHLRFSDVAGISAGAMTLYDYVADIPGKSRKYYELICHDPKFFGMHNLLTTGNFFNFDYMYECSNDQYRTQEEAGVKNSLIHYEVGATNCIDGKITWFSKRNMDLQQFNHACHASSNVPGINEPVVIDGVPYVDGGVDCPIPYQRLFDLSCERAVVILSHDLSTVFKPRNVLVEHHLEHKYRQYPYLVEKLRQTDVMHNEAYAELSKLQTAGKVFVFAPSDAVKISSLERDPEKLEQLYQDGLLQARNRIPELMAFVHA